MTKVGMQHLTLDTGDTRVSFREEVAPAVLDQLRPLTTTGEHEVPKTPGWTVKVTVDRTAAMVTVFRDEAPLVMFGVAADEAGAAVLWPLISQPAAVIGRDYAAPEPSAVPWLVSRLELGAAMYPEDLAGVGDFERCWAWAWLGTHPEDQCEPETLDDTEG